MAKKNKPVEKTVSAKMVEVANPIILTKPEPVNPPKQLTQPARLGYIHGPNYKKPSFHRGK